MSFGRLDKDDNSQPMSEINVTPLVDVMLVLLVIFIIAAPMMAHSLKLDLPQSAAATPQAMDEQAVRIGLDAQQQLFWNDEKIDLTQLSTRLQEKAQSNPNTELQLRADANVPYARVIEIITAAQTAGLQRIGFVAQEKELESPKSTP